MYNRLVNRRRAASSSSWGRLVAPTSSNRSCSIVVLAPSSWMKNSVFNRRLDSCSESFLFDNSESISSRNMTDGCFARAYRNRARTSFSPSPIHFEVRVDAEMLKKVAWECEAMHFPMSVLPVPGGCKRRDSSGRSRMKW